MLLYLPCSICGKLLRFPHEILGHTTLCPACGAQVLLSAVTATETPPAILKPAPLQEFPIAPVVTTPDAGELPALPPPVEPSPPAMDQEHLSHAPPQISEIESSQTPFEQISDHPPDEDVDDQVQWDVPATVFEPESPAPPPALPHWSPPPLGPTNQYPAPLGLRPMTAAAIAIQSANAQAQPPARRASQSAWIAAGIAIATACVVLVVALLLHGMGSSPGANSENWEQQNRDQIMSLKESAEDLALAGNLREAINKYESLQRLVTGHEITDVLLRKELDRAVDRRNKLIDQMMASPRPPATIAATESSVAPPKPPPVQAVVPYNPPPVAPPRPSIVAPAPDITPRRPKVVALTHADTRLTDQQIGQAIKKASDYLIAQFDGSQIPGSDRTGAPHDGVDALAVYALMQAGMSIHDERLGPKAEFMTGAVNAMRSLEMHDGFSTYDRSIRAAAIALYNQPQHRFILEQDVAWLLKDQKDGAFTYTDNFPRKGNFPFWDNSNSQYGLLGIWSGAEVDVTFLETAISDPSAEPHAPTGPPRRIPVPDAFWHDVYDHWTKCQLPSGEWGYRSNDTTGRTSMTLAGVASLFVAQDYLDPTGDRVGQPPFWPALESSLAWLESGDNSVIVRDKEEELYYTLYGLERVGLASGFKYFGKHDWYRQHAADLVGSQERDGSWGQSTSWRQIVDTSYGLLFLARGRHPVIMNKVRFDGNWANRPRDVANLARFASKELERPLNWQVVPLDRDWRDWTDSPILYLASDIPPRISEEDRRKFKNYIESGGLLLTQADGDSPAFTAFAEELGKKLFPQYEWSDLPADSSLWTINYKITERPRIRVITNGSRILMMNWPTDLSRRYQLREDKTYRWAFELGVNLAMYAAGREVSKLPNRLQVDYIPQNVSEPAASISLARLKYDGNWNPEPAAWPRAARWFRQQTGLGINIEETELRDLSISKAPLAHLTGTARFNPGDIETQAIKKYVEAGGVLIIDPCGTPGEFYQSAREEWLPRVFPASTLELMPADDPLLTASADGMQDLSNLALREYTKNNQIALESRPRILRSGKGAVLLFPLDLTTGLLPTVPWPIAGYTSETALALVKNLVLWTWDGAPEHKAPE